jgi:transglutaminase-like putative cysteine protease
VSEVLDPAAFTGATDVIDSADEAVRALAQRYSADAADEPGRVRALFDWVRDEIRYDMGPVLGERRDWTASLTLRRGYGFCQQKALLLAAMLRAIDVPAGIGIEQLLDHKIPPHFAAYMGGRHIPLHGYTLAFVSGRWQRIDATLDTALCERKRYRVVQYAPGSDRLLPETDLAGEPHVEHVGVVGEWADLPDDIVAATLDLPYLHDAGFLRMAARNGPGM